MTPKPLLLLTARYFTDSQILRETARNLGWETVRLEDTNLPDWLEPENRPLALYCTMPSAFQIAKHLNVTLLGCDVDWLPGLPERYLNRNIERMPLSHAWKRNEAAFVKPALNKAFPPQVYNIAELRAATALIPPNLFVYVIEPVSWILEFRCFVLDGRVHTLSPYLRQGRVAANHEDTLDAPEEEFAEAKNFCERLLNDPNVHVPRGLVIDVGIIEGRGWSVVEANQCWASGIYACNPERVLESLAGACVPIGSLSKSEQRWNFANTYRDAVPEEPEHYI